MKGLFLFACASLVACTGAVESSDPGPTPASPAAVSPSAPAAPSGPAASDSDRARYTGYDLGSDHRSPATPFVCRAGAFCEDFENAAWSTHWNDLVETSGGRMVSAPESASTGKGALRLFSNDETSSAFLLHSKGDVAGNWSGVMAFAFRVDQIPGKYLGGPEVTVKTSDGPITIRVALKPEGLVLEQLATEACLRDRCTPSSQIIAPSQQGHWYRITIGLEVNPRQNAPYGRVEAIVDGGELQGSDLTVPFSDGSVFFRAGITAGDGRAANADLDDVTLLVR